MLKKSKPGHRINPLHSKRGGQIQKSALATPVIVKATKRITDTSSLINDPRFMILAHPNSLKLFE